MFPFTSCVSILRRREKPADWRQINGTLTFVVCTPNNNHNTTNSNRRSSNSSKHISGKDVNNRLATVEEEVRSFLYEYVKSKSNGADYNIDLLCAALGNGSKGDGGRKGTRKGVKLKRCGGSYESMSTGWRDRRIEQFRVTTMEWSILICGFSHWLLLRISIGNTLNCVRGDLTRLTGQHADLNPPASRDLISLDFALSSSPLAKLNT
ncbi:hypothetical protein RRG08_035210 [Elysia crispata]|uniref:Uncharacterized protein n=1 Tax=Elysia crispata TaxID=231223 RepID=A0AAE1DIP3_9GAST|nr:hypothetical protein RRG08_035210 [Elysia crispata]